MRSGRPAVLALLLLASVATRATAQLPHLDPIPYSTAADSTSRKAAIFELGRFEDRDTGWSTNRLLTTVMLPAGSRAAWFLRLPVITSDRDMQPVAERWPEVIGTEGGEGWPHETIVSGMGQLEVGVTGPVGFGFMSDWRYGFAAGLPTSGNELYPWSAGGLPVRIQLRPGWELGAGRYLWLQAGYLAHLDASGDKLTPEAFPDGFQVGAELAWYRGVGRRWQLTWDWEDRDGRVGHRVGGRAWWPWGRSGSLGLGLDYELEGPEHRPASWYFTLAFRFDGSMETGDESTDQ